MNNDELKTVKTEFENELKSDKIYASIAKSIKKLIGNIPTELKDIEKNDNIEQTRVSACLKDIDNSHQKKLDDYQKSYQILLSKNETEIRKISKNRKSQIDKITKQFNIQIDDINKKRELVESEYTLAIKDIETTYHRDIASYQKVSQSARKLNQQVTLEIESEQQAALEKLKSTYEASLKSREQAKALLVAEYEVKKNEINERHVSSTAENNDIYLAIKTDYNQFSVIFNKKINELNKENQKALKTIKDTYDTKRQPIDALLLKLKEDYKHAIDKLKASYQEDLTKMNQEFEDQKQQYETKKARIIHESNEVISLLNSKLTAYKESINKGNFESAKDIRSKMKLTDIEHEKIDLQKELRANLKAANNEINKQILRTNKEIAVKQKEFHLRLYNHDVNYLKTLNTWRLNKNLLSYHYKQSLAKIDINFNHNIAQSKAQLSLNETIYKHQEQRLNLSLNRDLLSLETQLKIASLIQERELNLLTNDQQISINLNKLEQAKLEYDHQIALENLDFAQKQEALTYEYNQLTVSSNTQLELEKARNTRDFTLQEQHIRSEIAKKIYDRQAHILSIEKQDKTLSLNHVLANLEMNLANDIFNIQLNERLANHKRIAFMMKAAVRHQKRISVQTVKRQSQITRVELSHHHYHIIQFMSYLLLLHSKRLAMRQLTRDLYLLPSHPEIFKKALLLAMRFDHEIDHMMHDYIKQYEQASRLIFKQKMDDHANYQYVMKYEQVMKFYQTKSKRINQEQKIVENEIQNIEQNYIKYQSDIDQNKAFIEQLMKINNQIKSGLLPLQTSYDYKENIKLIKNHQTMIAHHKENMKQADKIISQKHHEINTLAKAQTAVEKSSENATKRLTEEKASESQFYLKHLVKLEKHYHVMSKKLSAFTNHSLDFYSGLKDLVYVTNNSIETSFKKLRVQKSQFERFLIHSEQRLLKDTLSYYEESQDLSASIEDSFMNRSVRYLDQISNSIQLFRKDQLEAKHIQETLLVKRTKAAAKDESHQREILKINHDKTIHNDLHDIKILEQKLDLHLKHSESELHALNENQQAIAAQYAKEVEQQIEAFEKDHQKHISFFKTRYINTQNDLETTNQTLLNKNQLLLIRYATQRSKTLETMHSKSVHYTSSIERHMLDIDKASDIYQKDIQNKEKQRLDDLKNIQNHMKRFEAQAENQQKAELTKETNALKRNLSFKLKALKLN